MGEGGRRKWEGVYDVVEEGKEERRRGAGRRFHVEGRCGKGVNEEEVKMVKE